MKRLIGQSDKNDGSAYDIIFKKRQVKGIHWSDLRRWKVLLKYYKGGNLLDLGCLDSQISLLIRGYSGIYLGIDQATEAIKEMRTKYGNPRSQFEVGDIYNLDIENAIMDYVVLGEIIEHVNQPSNVIDEAIRVLKPGGVLAISTPLEEAREPGAVDKDRHIYSFSKDDLIEMLRPYGKVKFKILRSWWFPYRYCWPQLLCWVFKGKNI